MKFNKVSNPKLLNTHMLPQVENPIPGLRKSNSSKHRYESGMERHAYSLSYSGSRGKRITCIHDFEVWLDNHSERYVLKK